MMGFDSVLTKKSTSEFSHSLTGDNFVKKENCDKSLVRRKKNQVFLLCSVVFSLFLSVLTHFVISETLGFFILSYFTLIFQCFTTET